MYYRDRTSDDQIVRLSIVRNVERLIFSRVDKPSERSTLYHD